MTDTQLLQLAAKAAGLVIDFTKKKGRYFSIVGTPHYWNPVLSYGNAFELADALRFMVDMTDERVAVTYGVMDGRVELAYDQNDRMAVNCLAITMLAADVGRRA